MTEYRQATHIEVEAEVRYWEDSSVNGVEDQRGDLIPGREGEMWHVRIELAAGRIEKWPAGTRARIHYKVCDQGEYWLTAADGTRIAKWKGHYVPDAFLCHGDEGFGDYIILRVGEDGAIEGYRRPSIDGDRWTAIRPLDTAMPSAGDRYTFQATGNETEIHLVADDDAKPVVIVPFPENETIERHRALVKTVLDALNASTDV